VVDEVVFEARDHFAIITINRPAARNAINQAVTRGLIEGLDRLESSPDLWVGILTGTPPAFCAGADLKEMANRAQEVPAEQRANVVTGFVARARTKPMIAAVEGPAVAGGCELVLACDLVVAALGATFGIPEVKRSLVAAAGGLFRLPRKIPENVAMACILTGDPLTAQRAYELGLVNELTEDGGAVDGALDLARRVCANAPVAVRESRAVALALAEGPQHEGWELSHQAIEVARASEDFREGIDAFVEKRPPIWSGR
jgi:enoyl-CoA hydratase